MINVKKEGVILRKTELDFENESVLNPAVIKDGDLIHIFYRAVHFKNYSSIGYCNLDSPLTVKERWNKPILFPEFDYEKHGTEDPRIVKIDGVYYLTYVAFDGDNALGAVATSTDLIHFEKQGIIVPKITYTDFDLLTQHNVSLNKKYLAYNEGANILADKDLVFFPRRINGKLVFTHRIKPDIQITAVKELSELTEDFWRNYFTHLEDHIFLSSQYAHEAEYVGSGCPPVETEHGWLVLYHGVKKAQAGYEYSCCAALMELDAPWKEIARLPYPLFKPDQDFELTGGDVDDVCFPTGTVLEDDQLYIYYGAADELIACASVSLKGLVEELLRYKK
jgi:beta-1,2-mannobiose phosphorylase / 1,2-beta-oligomannan phosphorylase